LFSVLGKGKSEYPTSPSHDDMPIITHLWVRPLHFKLGVKMSRSEPRAGYNNIVSHNGVAVVDLGRTRLWDVIILYSDSVKVGVACVARVMS